VLLGRLRLRLSSGLDGLAALADCQLVVEAVPEDLELKKQIFARVDRIVTEDAILATNTSSLSVTEIAVATSNPKRVDGMHFFNPAPVLQLVEVIRTVVTQDSVFEDVRAPAEQLGKRPVIVADKAGVLRQRAAPRIPQPRGVDVRGALCDPRGHRRRNATRLRAADGAARADGPHRSRHGIRDPRHDVPAGARPSPRTEPHLRQLVSAGLKGRKAGRGCYTYAEPGSSQVVRDALTPNEVGVPAASLRPVGKVGVVGSGTMATGIIEVFARAGYAVTFVARTKEKAAAVEAAVARSLRQGGRPGQAAGRGRRRRGGSVDRFDVVRRPGRRRPRGRGGHRGAGRQAGAVPDAGHGVPPGGHPGDDVVVAVGHRLCRRDVAAGGRRRDVGLFSSTHCSFPTSTTR